MKTGCFKTYKGNNGTSIAIYPPIDWEGSRFPALEPNRQTFFAKKAEQIDEKEYERRYREETLSKLNPQDIYNKLKGQVLLCWELPGDFCHRLLVSSWIQENLGIEVPEWKPEDDIKVENFANPLF